MHVTSGFALNVAGKDFFDPPPKEMPLTQAEQARSVANIISWRCYLPADCVNAMIAMGWDLST